MSAHRDAPDPDALANFLDGIPWRAMGLMVLALVAVPVLLLMFAMMPSVMALGWFWVVTPR